MTGNIRAPQRGDPFLSTWAQQVTAGVNSFCAVGPARGLVRDGFGGIGIEPLPENHRDRRVVGLCPFTLRHVEQDSDAGIPYTGYEIYLPDGCMTVGSSCRPMNPQAYRTSNGEKVNEDNWYRLPCPAEAAEDGSVWLVVAHAKCCSAIKGVDEYEAWPKHYVWCEIHERDRSEEDESLDQSDIGDAVAVTVGRLTWSEDDKGNLTSGYVNTVRGGIYVRGDDEVNPFALYDCFEVDEDELKISLDKRYVRNLSFTAAGATFLAYQMAEVEDETTDVYLKISTLTSPYTGEIKCYHLDETSEETMSIPEQIASDKQDGEIYLLLYQFKDDKLVLNNLSALQNIQVYSA